MMHCIIVEDEKAAQEVLKDFIDKTPFLNCLGIYESGLDITEKDMVLADLLFLDIQLPEINGISFLKTIPNPPKTIVTTAFANYAVDAFEENVLDYLLKPFSYERFLKAVTKAKQQIKIEHKDSEQVFLYADKTLHKVNIDDILFLKAEVDYVSVVTVNESILILDSLNHWEQKLSGFSFMRVQRSYIINLSKIDKISGNQVFIDNYVVPIGGTYKSNLISHVQNYR